MLEGIETATPVDPVAQKKYARRNLGRRLACIRKAMGLTQIKMAEILGVDQGTVCRWERGKWKSESLPRLQLLIYALFQGCTVKHLVTPVISQEDHVFKVRERTMGDVNRVLRVMVALELMEVEVPPAKSGISREVVLVQELLSLLNAPECRLKHREALTLSRLTLK